MSEQNFTSMAKLKELDVFEFYRQYDLWEKMIKIKSKPFTKGR